MIDQNKYLRMSQSREKNTSEINHWVNTQYMKGFSSITVSQSARYHHQLKVQTKMKIITLRV